MTNMEIIEMNTTSSLTRYFSQTAGCVNKSNIINKEILIIRLPVVNVAVKQMYGFE